MGRYQSSEMAHCGDQRSVVCAGAFIFGWLDSMSQNVFCTSHPML